MKAKEIIQIGREKTLQIFIPCRSDENQLLYIENRIKDIKNKKRRPVVLWNMRPWDNFNIIHAIYIQKLKKLQDLGFNCQIILYDKLVEKIKQLKNEEEIKHLDGTVESNIKWLLNSGLKIEHTEFLLESSLWKQINFEDFSNKTTFFAQHCKLGDLSFGIDEIFDRFWELYYEELVDCDFLLTGRKDKTEIWGMLRKDVVKTNHFAYTPPIILYFPQFEGFNRTDVTPEDRDSLLSMNDTKSKIFTKLKQAGAHSQFVKDIYDYFLLPYRDNAISYKSQEERDFSSFDKVVEVLNDEEIIDYCAEELYNYFNKINDGKSLG